MPQSTIIKGGIGDDALAGIVPPVSGATNVNRALARGAEPQPDQSQQFQGLGELLEEPSESKVFKTVDDLVLRQRTLSRSRLAQDRHWTAVKQGYGMLSELVKIENQDLYQQNFAPGAEDALRQAAVPNKQADLCNKLTETLMSDPAVLQTSSDSEDEASEQAAELAGEFLSQDGDEGGTDDKQVFWAQIEGATVRASTFNRYWVDATGGGSIPTQIKAHPQAKDPQHPLDAVDAQGLPIPTTDYVLRYVTADGGPDGAPAQFTNDPAHAARTWLPKIRIEKWGREHVRLFPEDKDLSQATCVVGLLYCTLGEAKRRWQSVGQMTDAECGQLCDWTPINYLPLLPAALRARWKLQTGSEKDPKGGSNDERVLFYYAYDRVSSSDYPKGATLYVSGAFGGTILDRDTLSCDVEMPSQEQNGQTVTDTKILDLPWVQIRLIQDTDEKDPTGTAFMKRIGPAGEAGETLATSYLEAIDIILHPARFATATSPLTADDVDESRTIGDFATVLTKDDMPVYEQMRPLPPNFFEVMGWQYEQMDYSAGLDKASTGDSTSHEVSGVARNIAVQRALVSVGRMQQSVNQAWKRHGRIKLQLAMKYYTVPQMIRYVGEDGASKQEWWTGQNFASVTDHVEIQPGTGTLKSPQDKVHDALQMSQAGLLDADDLKAIAGPELAKSLGVPVNPHAQRIERQVSSWLQGPPDGWVQQYQQYEQAMQAYQQQQQAIQAQMAQAMQVWQQQAAAAQQANAPVPPQPQMPPQAPPPTPPWTPFAALAMDDEPLIASLRQKRLAKLMAQVRFTAQPIEWQSTVTQAYTTARQAVSQAAMMSGPMAQQRQKLAGDLEEIRYKGATSGKAPVTPGAAEAEQQAVARDQQFIPGGQPAQPQHAGVA